MNRAQRNYVWGTFGNRCETVLFRFDLGMNRMLADHEDELVS